VRRELRWVFSYSAAEDGLDRACDNGGECNDESLVVKELLSRHDGDAGARAGVAIGSAG
jgi:hypothetical protein